MWLETLWTPATTDAAVAPAGANDIDPLLELLTDPGMLFRLVWGRGNEATGPLSAFVSVPAVAILLDAEPETDATLLEAFNAVVDDGADTEDAVEIEGNADPTVVAEVEVPVERTCDIVWGVGTNEDVELLAGSSYEGGGNTGLDDAFPVPDGPPPPVRRRGVEPAAPLAALNACCTICCWRAKTSLPLVTYPA